MTGQWIQLDGPTHLGLGFVEASEGAKIDAEHLVRLRVVRIELKSAAKQWFGGRPPPMKARRRLCNERVREAERGVDRKSTRLNSSHLVISYAVFCLKKKKKSK